MTIGWIVIFDDELTAKQIRNIEKELQVKILDRASLILDIFAMRAQTAEAKAQGSRDAYMNAAYWREFNNIVEED